MSTLWLLVVAPLMLATAAEPKLTFVRGTLAAI